jgi:hypothetical protein
MHCQSSAQHMGAPVTLSNCRCRNAVAQFQIVIYGQSLRDSIEFLFATTNPRFYDPCVVRCLKAGPGGARWSGAKNEEQ